MKALLLRLLGATFEVRRVNTKLGKDLPGTCLHKGPGYRAAKKAYNAAAAKAKRGQLIRLQAVVRMGGHLVAKSALNDPPPIMTPEVKSAAAAAEPVPHETHDIGASNARQSEFFRKHQDEPNVDYGDDDDAVPGNDDLIPDHAHDYNGPLVLHDGLYAPTCSICGEIYIASAAAPAD